MQKLCPWLPLVTAGLLLWASLALPLPLLAAQSTTPTAPPLAATASLSGQATPALTDDNRATGLQLKMGDSITLTVSSPATHLYLVWDTPHAGYTLQTEHGATQEAGQGGFLHDYTLLAAPASTLTLTLHQGEATLCDAVLLGEGQPPDNVQQWQPLLEKADLLVLPTHADDEHLFFGGALPLYAGEKGMAVQVAYLTNHWGEAYRPHELLNGLWEVGVKNYPLMSDFPDLYADSLAAAEGLYSRQEVLAWQTENLRRFKPSVVLGHDVDGEYGHGVHMLNASTLMEAVEAAPNPAIFPESAAAYGVWSTPKTYLHLWGENPILMDWNQPLSRYGGATALALAKAGFAQHKSQQTYFSVEDFGPYDCRKFGLYRSTVGPDVQKNDFFENIPALPSTPESTSEVLAGGLSQAASISAAQPASPQGETADDAKPPTALLALLAALMALGLLVLAIWLVRGRTANGKNGHKKP